MINDIANNFLAICKQNFIDKITPANASNNSKSGYIELVKIAQEYFNRGAYEEFSGFLTEGQYFVSLWAAHLLLEYGKPDKLIFYRSLGTIIDYSENPLAIDVAKEEKIWLNSVDLIVRHSSSFRSKL
ncbi:MAG TPA: hypothetical protein VF487_20755 [Chitinophagaceae bacterium]